MSLLLLPRLLSLNGLSSPLLATTPVLSASAFHTNAILERARQSTREKKRKVIVANTKRNVEWYARNPPPLSYKVKLMMKAKGLDPDPKPFRADEETKQFPEDNVYQTWRYCYKRMSLERAMNELKMHYHPSMLNRMDDFVMAKIEFNMKATKTDKFMDGFTKMVPVIHPFDSSIGAKNVCIFIEGEEEQERATKSGAFMVGGLELINEIAKGRVDVVEIDHFICHMDLVLHMKTLSGLLRDKLPLKSEGTVGEDVVRMLRAFRYGTEVDVKKITPTLGVANQPDYGYAEVAVGSLAQAPEEVAENLEALLESVLEHAPKRKDGGFVTRVSLQLEGGPHYASFSLDHPLVHDEKLAEFKKNEKKGEKQSLKAKMQEE